MNNCVDFVVENLCGQISSMLLQGSTIFFSFFFFPKNTGVFATFDNSVIENEKSDIRISFNNVNTDYRATCCDTVNVVSILRGMTIK